MASTRSQTPSSSTSISTTPTSWDVFLSFRGKDTRYGFTSHLYSALDSYNIRTYKDNPELRCGDVISDALLQAIQESRIYIVVLSKNYASSSWCLDELVEILNCSETKQRLVIPVFNNILPAVVRYQTDSFEEAFAKHEVRRAGNKERVKKWRLSLEEVANKSGKYIDSERMTLLLGPPSSGKTMLLLALVGKLNHDLKMRSAVQEVSKHFPTAIISGRSRSKDQEFVTFQPAQRKR